MNAVNLIPADRRTKRLALSTSPPTLALFGALVLVLIAAVLYVSAVNQVSARRSELAQVTASAAAWNAAAARYGTSVQAQQHHTLELADIRQLINGRFPWSELLGQVGQLMPHKSQLTGMQATTTPGATPADPPIPSVQLTGCAASQSTVADAMVALHRITDVTTVTLASATNSAAGPAGPAGANGGCTFPVQFQVSLTFRPAASPPAGAGSPTTPGSTSGTGSAASATVPAKTGAAQ